MPPFIPLRIPRPNVRITELLGNLFGPSRQRPFPISDTSPDDGLFGPDSVTWRVMREPLLTLASARALLLQAAHPLVAQGAIDHSTFAADPFGRFERTVTWVTQVAFGTTAEATRATSWINRLHQRVGGELPAESATVVMPAGTGYTALDPELLRWVHATFVDTMLVAHDAMVGGLTDADRDRFVREWHTVGRLLGVPRTLLWRDHAAMQRYIERRIASGAVMPGAGSVEVSRTVLHPPLNSEKLRPAVDLLGFISAGLLDARIREGYGIEWSSAHAAAHKALCLWVRTVRRALPRPLRISPVYDMALARSRGELEAAA